MAEFSLNVEEEENEFGFCKLLCKLPPPQRWYFSASHLDFCVSHLLILATQNKYFWGNLQDEIFLQL